MGENGKYSKSTSRNRLDDRYLKWLESDQKIKLVSKEYSQLKTGKIEKGKYQDADH